MANDAGFETQTVYEIVIRGIIGEEWSDWFDSMTIVRQGGYQTRLIGPVVDQAALHGLLCKIRNLGLSLISVRRVGDKPRDGETRARTREVA